MKHHGIYLALLVLFSVVLVCYAAESKAVDPGPKVEQNSVTSLNANTPPKTTDDNNVVSQEGTKIDPITDKSTKVPETKHDPKVVLDKNKDHITEKPKDKDHTTGKPNVKDGEEKKDKIDGDSNTLPKRGTTKGNTDPLKPPRKESARGEECGSSNNCIDEKNKLVACLRIPGNDSPELSLLVQYEGTTPLTAEISAPDSVQLEKKSVQFQDKGNQKVKVSLGKDNKNTSIILIAKGRNCSIDFSDLIQRNSAEKAKDKDAPNSSFVEMITKGPFLVVISIGIIAPIIGAILICYTRKQRQLAQYQKLETELPVSVTGKKETDEEEGGGWDDSWGDSWDDEEAPKTPSLPITPSLSSKGLASRKLTKDSWKD